MRTGLEKLLNQEVLFYATFDHYSTTRGRVVAIVKDIRVKDDLEILADHVWINRTSRMKDLNLQGGEIVSFYGKVDQYAHGKGSKTSHLGAKDYGISRISDVKVHRQYSSKDDRWPAFLIKRDKDER